MKIHVCNFSEYFFPLFRIKIIYHVEVADEFLSNLENIHKNAGKDSDSRELAVESRDKAVDYLVNLIEQNPEKKTLFFHMIYNLDPEKGEEIFRKITDMDFHAAEE